MPKTKKPSRSKLIKKLDNVFSQYIRLSRSDDQGFCTCVTCGKSAHWKEGGIQAGHFISRKHYSVRWDEDNVHPQCVGCNVFKAGEQYKYSIFLGEKLSEYLCCFTDASAYNYILLKTFEICSVGSLLLCEDSISNELSSLGFNDNINYISCNKQNLESKINWILDKKNRNQVDEIRINGMKLIREFHNTNNRAKYLNNIINNIK